MRKAYVKSLGILLIITGAVIAFFCWLVSGWEHRMLPRTLGSPALLDSAQAFYGREGCAYAVFRLEPSVQAAIRQDGLAFFGTDSHPPDEHPKNRFGPWHATPLPMAGDIPAAFAESDCGKASKAKIDAHRVLERPGNFLILSEDEETMVLVDTEGGLVGVLSTD